jgi:hypothetical protein
VSAFASYGIFQFITGPFLVADNCVTSPSLVADHCVTGRSLPVGQCHRFFFGG